MSGAVLLNIVIFVPLAGAILVGLMPKNRPELARLAALVVTVVTFVLSIALLVQFKTGEAGFQFVSHRRWIPQFGVGYTTGIDGISLWMVMLTTFLMPLGVLASWTITSRVKPYFAFLLALETGMLGVFSAIDMFLFYVFWEAVLIPMYFLIGMWGYERRIYAAMKFLLFTLVGSLLMLIAILALAFAARGPLTFDYRSLLSTPLSLSTQRLLFLGFFASFAVKVPLVPLHTWLPDAHTEAPTAGSVMLAGVLLKMGAYGLIRFAIPLFPDAAREFVPLMMALAIIGIVYGALVAIVQRDLKRLVAYSSVAHLGFIVLGIFVGTIQGMTGGILQMLNHGLSTGALFLLVGAIYDRRHTRQIAEFGGLARSIPILAGIFLFVLLSSIGLPGLNGFVGEFLILVGTFFRYRWWVVPAAFGIVLAAIYLLWAYQRVFQGEITREENRTLRDINLREVAMLAPVVALIVFIGVYPKPFLDRIEPSAARVVQTLRHTSVVSGSSSAARVP
ncbi:MAG TPA: NADH-quinone oxidoreductase subunit M [Actinomycetota bacterium]|jgi:NADH-quinone oxidoreductase subunit M|nr:NADH-quinone oxidoreductase subunit M [Actinomycetota bacterium]